MQVPILLGREINERDLPGTPEVAVVNQQFANESFPGQNPVGKHFLIVGKVQHDIEIVGLAKNTRYDDLKNDMPPIIFIPYAQELAPVASMTFVIRTNGKPAGYVNSVREIVRQRAAFVPVTSFDTQSAQIEETIHQEVTFARLCSVLAFLALVIACVGLYATMSYMVIRRTSEIGIRIALGARRGTIMGMVLRDVAVLVGSGITAGTILAFSTAKFIQSFLFGMKANDPMALTLAIAMLLVCAFLASYFPALRASQVEPIMALRHD
jgi:macrolide transport system ATP-binding/permease protein